MSSTKKVFAFPPPQDQGSDEDSPPPLEQVSDDEGEPLNKYICFLCKKDSRKTDEVKHVMTVHCIGRDCCGRIYHLKCIVKWLQGYCYDPDETLQPTCPLY